MYSWGMSVPCTGRAQDLCEFYVVCTGTEVDFLVKFFLSSQEVLLKGFNVSRFLQVMITYMRTLYIVTTETASFLLTFIC